MTEQVQVFEVDVPRSEVDELRFRIERTRYPLSFGEDWSRGTERAALQALLEYWAGTFDWYEVQGRLNDHQHVRVSTDIGRLHAMLAGDLLAPPLVLLHGWPDSFLKFESVVAALEDRFRLVVISLPGFGFSDLPPFTASPDLIADAVVELMGALGHERFAVHAGDIGAAVAEQLGARHPRSVSAIHCTGVPGGRVASMDRSHFSSDERDWAGRGDAWGRDEGAYAALQRTKPQTLAAALVDSPAGLASWQLEKFQSWSDGGAFGAIGAHAIAANLSLYWLTRTAGSAANFYYDGNGVRVTREIEVEVGVLNFPRDVNPVPRTIAERLFNVVHWTDAPRGGHFGAWEQPQLVADDLASFLL